MVAVIDAGLALPAGIPSRSVIVVLAVQVDGQVDPIPCRRDLELAIHLDIGPVVAEEEFDDIAIPEFQAIFAVVGGQPKI